MAGLAAAGNDVEGVKSVKDDLRADVVLHLRIFLCGGVGGVAIHVGVGGRDTMAGVTEEEVDPLWIREDKLVVGVQIGEEAIEGKAHILTLFDWGSFKSGLRNMGIAFSSVIRMDDCSIDLESLRRKRGGVEVRHEAIFAGDECGGST